MVVLVLVVVIVVVVAVVVAGAVGSSLDIELMDVEWERSRRRGMGVRCSRPARATSRSEELGSGTVAAVAIVGSGETGSGSAKFDRACKASASVGDTGEASWTGSVGASAAAAMCGMLSVPKPGVALEGSIGRPVMGSTTEGFSLASAGSAVEVAEGWMWGMLSVPKPGLVLDWSTGNPVMGSVARAEADSSLAEGAAVSGAFPALAGASSGLIVLLARRENLDFSHEDTFPCSFGEPSLGWPVVMVVSVKLAGITTAGCGGNSGLDGSFAEDRLLLEVFLFMAAGGSLEPTELAPLPPSDFGA